MTNSKILAGIQEIQQNLNKRIFPASVHLDELYDIKKSPDLFLEKAIELFNISVANLKLDNAWVLHLDIELQSESFTLAGCPKTLHDLKNNIDIYSMPELMIGIKQYEESGISKLEYYLCPLPFSLEGLTDRAVVMYSEYRRNDQEEYSRWLSIYKG